MLYWVCPLARGSGAPTCVLSPDDVMGEVAWTREVGYEDTRMREQPSRMEEITLAWSAPRCLNGAPPHGRVAYPPTRFPKANRRQNTLLLNARRSSSSFLTSRTTNAPEYSGIRHAHSAHCNGDCKRYDSRQERLSVRGTVGTGNNTDPERTW